MPFFSVIIPVYNKQKFVFKTIQSVLNQSYIDFEIIVINDGSTDESENEILKCNDNRIKYYSQTNNGVATTRNEGIKKATGKYICFLDADDFWKSEFLKTFKYYIDLNVNQKVFSCSIEFETSKKVVTPTYSIQRTNDFEIVNFFKASCNESVLWTSSSVFEKSVFETVGVFDTNLKMGEDTDLWIRIGLQYSIFFIWEKLAIYCFDQNSISRNLNYKLEEITFKKHEISEKTNTDLKKYLDLNRFSIAIKSKILGNKKEYNKYKNEISSSSLVLKKRVLLQLPSFILIGLIKLKTVTTNLGLGSSVFR